MILVLDNYDSFVHNLARYFRQLGASTAIYRNDAMSVEDVLALRPSHIVISPGPCDPDSAGISMPLIKHCAGKLPILGVCLGHQAIGQVFGAEVIRASQPMHGKGSWIHHAGEGLLEGLPNPFKAGRYHSLVVNPHTVPSCLKVTARSDIGEIMALEHAEHPIFGLQFHPESILTEQGYLLLEHFLQC